MWEPTQVVFSILIIIVVNERIYFLNLNTIFFSFFENFHGIILFAKYPDISDYFNNE